MPKMKTNKSAAKRLRVTGSGRLRRASANRRHLLTKKSSGRKRGLRGARDVSAADAATMRRLLGR